MVHESMYNSNESLKIDSCVLRDSLYCNLLNTFKTHREREREREREK